MGNKQEDNLNKKEVWQSGGGELQLHTCMGAGACSHDIKFYGEFCQNEMVGLDVWVQQQMKEGVVPLWGDVFREGWPGHV